MDNTKAGTAGMDVFIVANQVQTLHYRLHACALLPPRAEAGPISVEAVVDVGCGSQACVTPGPMVREAAAVPYAPMSARPRRRQHAAASPEVGISPEDTASPELWSMAVRALREKINDAIQAHVARLIEATGRDWEIRHIDFDEPRSDYMMPDAGHDAGGVREADAGARTGARITLVTQVILRSRTPNLH